MNGAATAVAAAATFIRMIANEALSFPTFRQSRC